VASVLFFAGEAGVASMMSALVKPFKQAGYKVYISAYDKATDVLESNFQGKIEDIDLVVCGHDDSKIDKTGTLLAQLKKIDCPVIGLLDSWKGVDRLWYQNGQMRMMTDLLAVIDESVRDYLIERGAPHGWLVVTGHPGFDRIREIQIEERTKFRQEGRKKLSLEDDRPTLLIFSEPLRLPDGTRPSLLDMGTIYGCTVQEWIETTYGDDFLLLCRMHPIEKKTCPVGWVDAQQVSFEHALFMADKVIGLASTTLAYAVASEVRVDCIDEHIKCWKPEYSDIPSSLWTRLITSGVFQNNPDRLLESERHTLVNSSSLIVAMAEELI
jgi:hypothetical protein